MLVRPAGPHDIDTIADTYVASFAGLSYLPQVHTDVERRSWIGNVVVTEQEVWVAEDDGRVVGFASLSERTLELLYVEPESQSRGVGRALLDRVKRERADGFDLWVFQRNERARRFYERHGLRLVELTDGSGNEEREPDARYEWVP